MPAARSLPRTIRVTALPRPARYSAPWPAEFAPADDRDRVRTAGPGLQLRRREIDARALELRPPVEWQGAVAGTGGDDHCSRLDSGVVGQHDPQTLVGGVQPGSLAGACDTGAEFLCLHRGAAG